MTPDEARAGIERRLMELAALLENATPRPWSHQTGRSEGWEYGRRELVCCDELEVIPGLFVMAEDALLTVNAVNWLPALIATAHDVLEAHKCKTDFSEECETCFDMARCTGPWGYGGCGGEIEVENASWPCPVFRKLCANFGLELDG